MSLMWLFASRVADAVGRTNEPVSVTTIRVLPLNDPPVLDLDTTNPNTLNSQVEFLESAGFVNILPGSSHGITDPDSTLLSQAVISFVVRQDGDRESLRLDPNLNIPITFSNFDGSGAGELTIQHTADFNTWLRILSSVQYVNEEENPNDAVSRLLQIVVQDDGSAISDPPVSVEVVLVAVNNPPELFLGGLNSRGHTITFVEDGPCVSVTAPDVLLRDSDSTAIRSIRISIAGANVNRGFESVDFNGTRPQGVFGFNNILVIFLAPGFPADYEDILRGIVYCNTEDEPNEIGGRSISFVVTDNGLMTSSGRTIFSATSTSTTSVSITRVNDQPQVSFQQLDDISIRNIPTPIIDPSSITIDDSDDTLFDVLRIYITNPQNTPVDEIIEFSRQLPESSISRGPTILSGPQFLYTVTFTGGADVQRVTETISQLRYSNNADPADLIVEPPRQICLDLSDSKIFSELTCVDVTISPPNNHVPVFLPGTPTAFSISESSQPITISTLQATDGDGSNTREGTIVYSIDQVLSLIGSGIRITTDIFTIDPAAGQLTAPNGLDAEVYQSHEITVLASDQGNPIMSASLVLIVTVLDVNDEAPVFEGLPYVATPQREQLNPDPPNPIFTVFASDPDISQRSTPVTFELQNFQDRFRIRANGAIESYQTLDAEDQQTYELNVSASDSGSPPLVSYATVSFSLIDTNDNAAVVDQVAPALHVVDAGPSSIGPAIRISDRDLDAPAISSISIVLTPSTADLSRTYDQCLVQCQDARLAQANLSPPPLDLLGLATFENEQRTTVGSAACPAVTVQRNADRNLDGYGTLERSDLPASFASGQFSVSFVLTMQSEGFILIVPDRTDPTLSSSVVGRVFGIWLRRRNVRVSYLTGSVPGEQRTDIPIGDLGELFDPAGPFQTRHFTVVVSTNPARIALYLDCIQVGTANLVGDMIAPDPSLNVFIGRGQPHPLTNARLGGQIHGLFYHPTALTEAQIIDFCSCGFEALVLPSLPSGLRAEVDANQHSITLQAVSGLIPNLDAVNVLRAINYTNQFDAPTLVPLTRALDFTLTEENGVTGRRAGAIRLVLSDNNPPVLDLNGVLTPGFSTSVTFQEDSGAVTVAPAADISRDIEGFTVDPTFYRVEVRLTNPQDQGEVLTATPTDVINVLIVNNGRGLDIIGPGLSREFAPVLQSVQYNNLNDNPTTSPSRSVTFTAFDTEGRSSSALATITLDSVNDAPRLSLAPNASVSLGNVQFVEGSSGVLVAPTVTVIDVDDTQLVRAEVTLSSPVLSADLLSINETSGLSSSYDGAIGVLTLSGSGDLSQYQAALSSLLFSSVDSPFLDVALDSLTRNVSIEVFDQHQSSNRLEIQVQFMPNNDAPLITLATPTVLFRDGDASVLIAPSANISDSDNRQLVSMTVELEGAIDNNVLRSGQQEARVLVSSRGSVAEYISTLRSIAYVNLAAEPSLIERRINIEVCDFLLCSQAVVTVEIRDVNDNSPAFLPSTYQFSIRENSAISTSVGVLTAIDADVNETSFTFASNQTFFELVPVGSSVRLETAIPLNFEDVPTYQFTVTVSDGVSTGSAQVTVTVLDENEPPVLSFEPANPTLVIGPDSRNTLIQVQLLISDPDFSESLPTATLTLRNVPDGSVETLEWSGSPDYTFTQESGNIFRLNGPGDVASLRQALENVSYVAGEQVSQPTTIRTVAIVIFDGSGAQSEEVVVTVSLASIPRFSQEQYQVALVEGSLARNFLQVRATVDQSGGDLIEFAVEEGKGVIIDNSTGQLSLVRALDREEAASLLFSVFAIDALPPARTGTATVNISITDLDDVRPSITGLNNVTVSTGEPVSLFPSILISDPDSIGSIMRATISVLGSEPLQPLSFTGVLCVDEPNAISKMEQVCGGLEEGVVLLEQPLAGQVSLGEDSYDNDVLVLNGSATSAVVGGNFSGFSGLLDAFTFVAWIRAEDSGYLAYFGSSDSLERYFALYYNRDTNQLIVTLKREGLSGLSAQIRISFQLSQQLADGRYHFLMLQYSARNLICVLDGQLTNSMAVVYKEKLFIGEVFGECMR